MDADYRLSALDRAARGDERVLFTGAGARGLEAIDIALRITKFERILGDSGCGEFVVTAFVEQLGEPMLRPDSLMVIACGANVEIVLQFLGEHQGRKSGV